MKNILLIFVFALALAACQGDGGEAGSSNDGESVKSLTAAGATFPLPFYNLVFKSYTRESGILLTYGGIGSGGGIRSLKDRVVDFGATDAFLSDEKIADMPGEIVLPVHILMIADGSGLQRAQRKT